VARLGSIHSSRGCIGLRLSIGGYNGRLGTNHVIGSVLRLAMILSIDGESVFLRVDIP